MRFSRLTSSLVYVQHVHGTIFFTYRTRYLTTRQHIVLLFLVTQTTLYNREDNFPIIKDFRLTKKSFLCFMFPLKTRLSWSLEVTFQFTTHTTKPTPSLNSSLRSSPDATKKKPTFVDLNSMSPPFILLLQPLLLIITTAEQTKLRPLCYSLSFSVSHTRAKKKRKLASAVCAISTPLSPSGRNMFFFFHTRAHQEEEEVVFRKKLVGYISICYSSSSSCY